MKPQRLDRGQDMPVEPQRHEPANDNIRQRLSNAQPTSIELYAERVRREAGSLYQSVGSKTWWTP